MIETRATLKRKLNTFNESIIDTRSQGPKRRHLTEPLSLSDSRDQAVHSHLPIASAPRFIAPEYGRASFDPSIIVGPWDERYSLILP